MYILLWNTSALNLSNKFKKKKQILPSCYFEPYKLLILIGILIYAYNIQREPIIQQDGLRSKNIQRHIFFIRGRHYSLSKHTIVSINKNCLSQLDQTANRTTVYNRHICLYHLYYSRMIQLRHLLYCFLSLFILFLAKRLIQPLWLYFKAVREYGPNGVIFVYKPFTGFLSYHKWSNQEYGRPSGYIVQELQTKPDAKIAILTLLNFTMVFILDAQYIKLATNEHVKKMRKRDYLLFLNEFKKGLVFSEGETWKRSRNILSDLFKFDALKSRQPTIENVVKMAIDGLDKKGDEVNLHKVGLQIGGEAVLLSLFGSRFAELRFGENNCLQQIMDLIRGMIDSARRPLNALRMIFFGKVNMDSKLLTEKQKQLVVRIRIFRQKCEQFLKEQTERYKKAESVPPFIEAYLKFDNEELTKEIVDQVIIFLIAGQDTTGITIEDCMYALAQYPEWQEKILTQVEGTSRGELHKCIHLNNFINQTLRLLGPVRHSLSRVVIEKFELDGLEFKVGTQVMIAIGMPMLNPKYFDDPLNFDPNRFSKPLEHPFSFVPFSSGPRNCIGQHMSNIEVRIFIAELLRKYKLIRTKVPFSLISRSFGCEPLQHNLVRFKPRHSS